MTGTDGMADDEARKCDRLSAAVEVGMDENEPDNSRPYPGDCRGEKGMFGRYEYAESGIFFYRY